MDLSPETIKAKIADIIQTRDKFIADVNASPFMVSANLEIARYNGRITVLEELIEEPSAETAEQETPAAK